MQAFHTSVDPTGASEVELLEVGGAFFELDSAWRLVRANRSQEMMSGIPRSESVGRSVWDLWPDIARPESAYWREYHRCMEERVSVQFEDFYEPLQLWASVVAHPLSTGGIAVFVRDITAEVEGRNSKRQLEAERVRLQAIIDTIPTGLIMLDELEQVVENAEWKRTWAGVSRKGAVIDYNGYKGFIPETGERLASEDWPCALALKKGISTFGAVLDIERFDGTAGTIVVSSAPLRDESGKVIGAVAANMDITELRAVQARLQEADKRKDEFLMMLSHELRNPIQPICTSLYILDRVDPSGPQAKRARDAISRQVKHLTKLVDELLDATRIARGKVTLQPTNLDLVALVKRIAADYSDVLSERGVDLVIEGEQKPIFIEGDETRLAQVLGNLLSNAAKFTEPGGRVTLGVTEGEWANIHVKDTGVGVAPALLPKLFEPFTQADQGLARTAGGLGLGLSIAKGLVDLHEGNIAVTSTPGQGTEFVVRLPLTPAMQLAGPASPASAFEKQIYQVLVVEDNVDAADALAELIRMLGHHVEVAHDGLSGVALAEANPPDLILCDLGLPGIDGYEVARTLKPKLAKGARLVAVSGYALPEDMKKSAEAGFELHFTKPADPARIEQLLIDLPSIPRRYG